MPARNTLYQHSVLLAIIALAVVLFAQCDNDKSTTPTPPENGDFFPLSREYRWTYTSDIPAQIGAPDATVYMKLDTATEYDGDESLGTYWWVFTRSPASMGWDRLFAIVEEGNEIFSLGDKPRPWTQRIPLGWRHSYSSTQGTRETITVQGKVYNTVRVDRIADGVKISWWFAPDVGLVKEYSEQGGSLFTEDWFGKNAKLKTELVSYTK